MIFSEFTLKLQFLIQLNTQESTQSTVGASLHSVFHHFLFNTSQYQQRAHHEDGRLLLMIWWPNRPNFLIAQNKQRLDFSGYHTACAKQWHGSNKSSGGCVFLKPRTKVRTPSFLNVKNCSKPQQGRFSTSLETGASDVILLPAVHALAPRMLYQSSFSS